MRERGEEGEGPLRSLPFSPQRKTRGQAPVPMWEADPARPPSAEPFPGRAALARSLPAASVMGQLLGGAPSAPPVSPKEKTSCGVHPLSPMLLQARAFP